MCCVYVCVPCIVVIERLRYIFTISAYFYLFFITILLYTLNIGTMGHTQKWEYSTMCIVTFNVSMWYCCAFILPFSLFLCAVLKVLRDFIKLKRQLLAQMGVFVCECVGFLIIHQFGLFYIDFRFCKHLMCHVEYFDSWRWCFRHKAIRFMFHLEEICFFSSFLRIHNQHWKKYSIFSWSIII